MKKIDYYKFCRNEKTKEHEFMKSSGYFEKVYNPELTNFVNVVYEKDNSGWRATHLESGLAICIMEKTRKDVILKVKSRINAVLDKLKDKTIQEYIQKLSDIRNNELIRNMKNETN